MRKYFHLKIHKCASTIAEMSASHHIEHYNLDSSSKHLCMLLSAVYSNCYEIIIFIEKHR